MKKHITCDGNTAAANIAYKFSEIAAIYPITPSSSMGELADLWSSQKKLNLFNTITQVREMQSEAGAAGAIHGSLVAGALTTTFTASQGLLLMLPNMFKIAGELLPTVFHVAARSLAAQSLSIFGDHSDVMAARTTGFALLASANVQEAQDLAVIAHLSTLESRVPFVHFFDGFRTSASIKKIKTVEDKTLKSLINFKHIREFRENAIRPEKPLVKVGAQNPDVYFQGRETVNKYYDATPDIVQKQMNAFAKETGRQYKLFSYYGHPEAEKIIILMGSGCNTTEEIIDFLKDEKIGYLKIHLYRPFSIKHFINEIPKTVRKIAVLDRTKEPGSIGEPLYMDVVTAFSSQENSPKIIGGRYGLSSKEFTPSMVKAVFDYLDEGKHNFTVGINDDVTNLSIPIKEDIICPKTDLIECKFWGYGSDGTITGNKSTIKIIGENTNKNVQAYFEYDSKKSGGVTVSHLRFGDQEIKAECLVEHPDFVALHKYSYIGRYDILEGIKQDAIFLINSPLDAKEVFESLTEDLQNIIIEKKLKVFTIDAFKIAKEHNLGNKISIIMQTAFFKLTDIIPFEDALKYIAEMVKKEFKSKGEEIINKNLEAIKHININPVVIHQTTNHASEIKLVSNDSFVNNIISPIMRKQGNLIPVSQMPVDGIIPLSTSKLEKRNVAEMVPVWDPEKCIQCGQCSFVCPHAAIRTKQFTDESLQSKPDFFNVVDSKISKGLKYRVQVYTEDCLGCTHCVKACPTGALKMVPIEDIKQKEEIDNQKFFDSIKHIKEGAFPGTIQESQFRKPLFEFSGACSGCGETPYIKLVTQLFGDRMIIANATGCSSIYGGTFPTTPYATNEKGEGPAWANSLFEDNAEYGYGMRIAINNIRNNLKIELQKLPQTDDLKKLLENWNSTSDETKELVEKIKPTLPKEMQDYLMEKSVWIFGGDGWAYDIGFGGLDHVVAQGKNVNILILDNEQYANTGGQTSKATPRGATAKFSVAGKDTPKKNLGLMMMSYGNVYIASINLNANKMQTLKAIKEAEAFDGPSIIIAYSNCIAHGINMEGANVVGKDAVDSGYWPLYRYSPKTKLVWDSPEIKSEFSNYVKEQNRYSVLEREHPEIAKRLLGLAKTDNEFRNEMLKNFGEKNV